MAGQLVDFSATAFRDAGEKRGHQRQKIGQSVRLGTQNDNAKGAMVEPLLLGDAFVQGNQNVKPSGHYVEQRTIVEIGPTHFNSF
ncbi:MAG: hypothetical protein H7X91_07110 [Burkholderiales bacterium]|nr:hypothetical protein [Burkholderiales bacterium]